MSKTITLSKQDARALDSVVNQQHNLIEDTTQQKSVTINFAALILTVESNTVTLNKRFAHSVSVVLNQMLARVALTASEYDAIVSVMTQLDENFEAQAITLEFCVNSANRVRS